MNMALSTVGVGSFDEGECQGGVDLDAALVSTTHACG